MLQEKILETLILAADNQNFVAEPTAVVLRAFPNMTEPEIVSVFASLANNGLVSYHLSPKREIIMFEIAPAARAVLIAVREAEAKREKEKWLDRVFGFISGVAATVAAEHIISLLFAK